MDLPHCVAQLDEDITLMIDLIEEACRVAKDSAPYLEERGSKIVSSVRRCIDQMRPAGSLPFTIIVENTGNIHVWGHKGIAHALGLSVGTVSVKLSKGEWKFSRNHPDTGELSVYITVVRGHHGENSIETEYLVSRCARRRSGRPAAATGVSTRHEPRKVTKAELAGMTNKLKAVQYRS